MKNLLPIVFILCGMMCWAQPSPQSKKVTEKFFPDPDVEINTPAFQKKRGFTDYEEMMAYISKRIATHPQLIKLTYIGTSQKGKQIPMLTFNRPNGNQNKLKVWMQGGLHGDEPASTEGLLYLMDKLLSDTAYSYLLDRIELAMVPMANIDGFEKQNRYAANGLDLNRDQTKLMAQESVFLKQAFSDFGAQVALDFHEYRAFRRDFTQLSTYGVTNGFDVMFLYSGNLNVPKSLREYTKQKFVKNAIDVLDENQLTHHDYFSASKVMGAIQFNQGSLNARSSATSYALSNAVSSLIEIRGVGIGKTSFTRRVYSTFLVAQSYLRTAYANEAQVREEVKKAIAARDQAVISVKSEISQQPIPMIDIETNEKIVLDVTLKDAWKSSPVKIRQRPTAYLLLPDQQLLAEKLKVLGLRVDQLSAERQVEVQAYTVVNYDRNPEKYEGVYRQEVTAETALVTKTFPAGTYVVYMDQPKANLAVEVLEPEAPNSFVSFAVLETEQDKELPIYRYLQKDTL